MSAHLDAEDLGNLGSFIAELNRATSAYGFYINMEGVEILDNEGAPVGLLICDSAAGEYSIAVKP